MSRFRGCFHGGLGDSVRQRLAADFSLSVPKESGAEFSRCFQDFGVKWISVVIFFAEPKFVRRHGVVCFSIFRGPLKGCFQVTNLKDKSGPTDSFSLFASRFVALKTLQREKKRVGGRKCLMKAKSRRCRAFVNSERPLTIFVAQGGMAALLRRPFVHNNFRAFWGHRLMSGAMLGARP